MKAQREVRLRSYRSIPDWPNFDPSQAYEAVPRGFVRAPALGITQAKFSLKLKNLDLQTGTVDEAQAKVFQCLKHHFERFKKGLSPQAYVNLAVSNENLHTR